MQAASSRGSRSRLVLQSAAGGNKLCVKAVSPTDLLADLHVFLEAVDCFPGDDGAGGTHHFPSLRDRSLPLGVGNGALENTWEPRYSCHGALVNVRSVSVFSCLTDTNVN